MEWWSAPFELAFQQRALLGGILAALMASTVGTWLVLRGMSFFGDAFVHGVIPGVAAAVVLERHRAAPDTRLGDDDVGANVSLGWARLYLMRLSASRDLLYLGPKDGAAEEERPIPE